MKLHILDVWYCIQHVHFNTGYKVNNWKWSQNCHWPPSSLGFSLLVCPIKLQLQVYLLIFYLIPNHYYTKKFEHRTWKFGTGTNSTLWTQKSKWFFSYSKNISCPSLNNSLHRFNYFCSIFISVPGCKSIKYFKGVWMKCEDGRWIWSKVVTESQLRQKGEYNLVLLPLQVWK